MWPLLFQVSLQEKSLLVEYSAEAIFPNLLSTVVSLLVQGLQKISCFYFFDIEPSQLSVVGLETFLSAYYTIEEHSYLCKG